MVTGSAFLVPVARRRRRSRNATAGLEIRCMKFDSTLPADEVPLMPVSEFHRYLGECEREVSAGATTLGSLNPSLMQDLQRFVSTGTGAIGSAHQDGEAAALELLEVLAAAVRHARALSIHLQHEYRVLTLTVFPLARQMHCPLPAPVLLGWRLPELRVLHVEPARIPAHDPAAPGAEAHLYAPLAPLLWELALRGAREALLPEIAGLAAYRVAPGADLSQLEAGGSLAAALQRLRREAATLQEIAVWPGFDRERAMRLLNALYLQAALRVSRTHPAATNEGWGGGAG
jgi:hypothetical protein